MSIFSLCIRLTSSRHSCSNLDQVSQDWTICVYPLQRDWPNASRLTASQIMIWAVASLDGLFGSSSKGVSPSWLRAFKSAPNSSNKAVTSASPLRQATCSAVRPVFVASLTRAPLFSKRWREPWRLNFAAENKQNGYPSRAIAFTSAPVSRRTCYLVFEVLNTIFRYDLVSISW